jgi:hypothetical protein
LTIIYRGVRNETGQYNWGPVPPAVFLQPDDLMELAAAQPSVPI